MKTKMNGKTLLSLCISLLVACGGGSGGGGGDDCEDDNCIIDPVEPTTTTMLFNDSGQTLGANQTWAISLGDLDGDGDLNLVTGNLRSANRVYLNDGSGIYTDTGQSLGSEPTLSTSLGDVDNDGDLDLVTGNYEDVGTQDNRIYLNDGAANFTDSGQALGPRHTTSTGLGDVDGDGDLDLVTGSDNGASLVHLNDGAGIFVDSGQTLLSGLSTYAVSLRDIENDGDLDLVMGIDNNPVNWSRIFINDGIGIFTDSGQVLAMDSTRSVSFGDMDGDGNLDLVTGNRAGPFAVYFNDGAGNFIEGLQPPGASDTYSIAVGDLDGDGDLDVVEGNSDNSSLARSNQIHFNDGAGIFGGTQSQTFGSDDDDTRAIGVADIDGDGDLDLIAGNGDGQANRVYFNLSN